MRRWTQRAVPTGDHSKVHPVEALVSATFFLFFYFLEMAAVIDCRYSKFQFVAGG